jgi:CubicO group peptidase (beta-lactamase class C family)
MEKIMAATGQPGVSVGVLHRGEIVLNHSIGHRDVDAGIKADGDTLYCIASLTKAFVAAALNLVIHENGLSWSDKVADLVPGLGMQDDQTLTNRLTLTDLVSHRNGTSSLDQFVQGLDGRVLVPKKDVVHLMNELPVRSDLGTEFWYSNVPFSVAGKTIEDVGKQNRWDEFLQDKVLGPLAMGRTTADAEVVASDSNVATPYACHPSGSVEPLAQPELSASTLHGCTGGIRSSITDMLKWCRAILSATKSASRQGPGQTEANSQSPLLGLARLFDGTVIISPRDFRAGEYCRGWVRQTTPTTLGRMSPNRAFFAPVMGRDSSSRLACPHNGETKGFMASLYLFPEDDAAIVALSNGAGLSDCTDWIVQDIAQSMLDFQPVNDYVSLAQRAASMSVGRYHEKFVVPLDEHQVKGTQRPQQRDFVGKYTRSKSNPAITISVALDGEEGLKITPNSHVNQSYILKHYHYDTWSLLPGSEEEASRRGYFVIFNN